MYFGMYISNRLPGLRRGRRPKFKNIANMLKRKERETEREKTAKKEACQTNELKQK